MSLPNKPTEEIKKYYIDSELFWAKRFEDRVSCNMWYEFQKITQDMEIKSILNVGIGPAQQAGKWAFLLEKIFGAEEFFNIDIVEKYVEGANASSNPLINRAAVQDVRTIDDCNGVWDLSFWSHGPEHITRADWTVAFEALEKVTKKIIILQCPWGNGYDYDHEHLAKSIEPEEFHAYGYKTLHCGCKGSKDTNILAWKIK